jgi:hypothetical protein
MTTLVDLDLGSQVIVFDEGWGRALEIRDGKSSKINSKIMITYFTTYFTSFTSLLSSGSVDGNFFFHSFSFIDGRVVSIVRNVSIFWKS